MKTSIAVKVLTMILGLSTVAYAGNGQIGSAENKPASRSSGNAGELASSSSTCSANSYEYRITLNAKKTAKMMHKFAIASNKYVEIQQGVDTLGSTHMSQGLERTVKMVGSYLTFMSEKSVITQDARQISESLKVIKKNCPMFNIEDVKNALKVELRKLDFSSSPITFDLNDIQID